MNRTWNCNNISSMNNMIISTNRESNYMVYTEDTINTTHNMNNYVNNYRSCEINADKNNGSNEQCISDVRETEYGQNKDVHVFEESVRDYTNNYIKERKKYIFLYNNNENNYKEILNEYESNMGNMDNMRNMDNMNNMDNMSNMNSVDSRRENVRITNDVIEIVSELEDNTENNNLMDDNTESIINIDDNSENIYDSDHYTENVYNSDNNSENVYNSDHYTENIINIDDNSENNNLMDDNTENIYDSDHYSHNAYNSD
ncbi:hypothetical protein PFMALIP_05915, partial [Plasmodium falciparum MaliPS096_E11]